MQAWQSQQMSALDVIFDSAVDELNLAGVRILTGSLPPVRENLPSVAQIALTPIRYGLDITKGSLTLTLRATATNGPGRYIVALQISGEEPNQALARLMDKNPDVWRTHYLDVGLWVRDGEDTEHLNILNQLRNRKSTSVSISGVMLHSSSGYTVQAALMSIGVLYRSVLDELSNASKMARLSTCVLLQLNGRRPNYDRIFRP
jgi:hypothetical protein